MHERRNPLVRFFSGIWRAIDGARKVAVNLLFVAIVIALLVVVFTSDDPEIAESTALVIAPKGQLVEQLSAKTVERMIDEARGTASPETLLKDVIDAIEAASKKQPNKYVERVAQTALGQLSK